MAELSITRVSIRVKQRLIEEENQRLLQEQENQRLKEQEQIAATLSKVPMKRKDHISKIKTTKKRSRITDNIIHLPPSYRKLQQNLYKAPLQRPTIISMDDDTSCCECPPDSEGGCDENCQNRLLYMECVPGKCHSLLFNTTGPSSQYCKNTVIQTKSYPSVEVFLTSSSSVSIVSTTDQTTNCTETNISNTSLSSNHRGVRSSSSNNSCHMNTKTMFSNTTRAVKDTATTVAGSTRGYGLRVTEQVKKGTIVIEYLGEVITAKEGIERMSAYKKGDDFYFMGLESGLMLDAKYMGSVARFANHSCSPSCILQKWRVLGECRVVLVAKRDLPSGTEITYNYNYFTDGLDGSHKMKRQICYCGSVNCCGTIGGKVLLEDPNVLLAETKEYEIRKLLSRCREVLHGTSGSKKITYPGLKELVIDLERNQEFITNSTSYDVYANNNNNEDYPSDVTQLLLLLRKLGQECEDWNEQYERVITVPLDNCNLVDPQTVLALLEAIPMAVTKYGVKLETFLHLETLYKNAQKVIRTINTLLPTLTRAEEQSTTLCKIKKDKLEGKQHVSTNGLTTNGVLSLALTSNKATCSDISTMQLPDSNPQSSPSSLMWDDLVYVMKEIKRVAPIDCGKTSIQRLFTYYINTNKWCRSYISPVITKSKSSSILHSKENIDKNLIPKSDEHTKYMLFQSIYALYCRNDTIDSDNITVPLHHKKPPPAKGHTFYGRILPMDLFINTQQLETRLSTLIRKNNHKININYIESNNINLGIADSLSSTDEPTEQVVVQTGSVTQTPPLLYCFCCLPEEEGESNVMSECNVCKNWYHPQCINSDVISLSAATTAHSEEFLCPLCVHCCKNKPSNFSYAPFSEWSRRTVLYKQQSRSNLTTVALSKSSDTLNQQVSPTDLPVEPVGADCLLSRVDVDEAAVLNNNEGLDINNNEGLEMNNSEVVILNSAETTINTMPSEGIRKKKRQIVDTTATTTSTCSKNTIVRSNTTSAGVSNKDFWTSDDLHIALEKEKSLMLRRNPVALLLGLSMEYFNAWYIKCQIFLSSPEVLAVVKRIKQIIPITTGKEECPINNYPYQQIDEEYVPIDISTTVRAATSSLGAEEYVPIDITTTVRTATSSLGAEVAGVVGMSITNAELQQEYAILRHSLLLYFELRIIRLYGKEQCSSLRQIAWIISASTLLRGVNSSVDGNSDPYIPSVEELVRIVEGGEMLFRYEDYQHHTLDIGEDKQASINSIIFHTGNQLCFYLRDSCLNKVLQLYEAASSRMLLCDPVSDWPARVDMIYQGFQTLIQKKIVRFSAADSSYVKIAVLHVYKDLSTCLCQHKTMNSSHTDDDNHIIIEKNYINTINMSEISFGSSLDTKDNSIDDTNNLAPINLIKATIINTDNTNKKDDRTTIITNVNNIQNNITDVYCWCRGIDDGTPMIQCDCCDQWYHCLCVGVNGILDKKKKIKKNALNNIASISYVCIYCSFMQGKI